MTTPTPPGSADGVSHDRRGNRRRGPWWVLVLAAVVLGAALLMALSQCGGTTRTSSTEDPHLPGSVALLTG